jgi:hypothetical protein
MPENFNLKPEDTKAARHAAGNIIWYDEKTLILRAKDMEQMGLKFVSEKHGAGPVHYSCQIPGKKAR